MQPSQEAPNHFAATEIIDVSAAVDPAGAASGAASHAQEAEAGTRVAAGPATSPAGRVLVIDDDPRILSFVCQALELEGYEVQAAPDGAAALDLLWQFWDCQPDVILLDMRMPSVDGWRFVEAYRVLPVKQASIVVMTAAWRAEDWAAEVDADDVLAKPFDLDELLDRVAHARAAQGESAQRAA